MRLSCIPICLFPKLVGDRSMSLDQWLDMAERLGLDGIEMYEPYLQSPDPAYMRSAADAVRRRGLSISMFTGYGDLAHPDDSMWAEQIAIVQSNVDAAVVMGTKLVRVVAGQWHEGQEREATLDRVAEALRRCLPYARDRGVTLAFEDHPAVGTAIADFLAIIQRVADDDLKVNLDTSNPMESGDSAVELVNRIAERVVHVHGSDRLPDLQHVVPGDGAVDFEAIFGTLQRAGFDGWVSSEAGGAGEADIARGLAYLRHAWEQAR